MPAITLDLDRDTRQLPVQVSRAFLCASIISGLLLCTTTLCQRPPLPRPATMSTMHRTAAALLVCAIAISGLLAASAQNRALLSLTFSVLGLHGIYSRPC